MRETSICARWVAVLAACASMSLGAADVVVDVSRELGPVKPVNGVGQPPMQGGPTRFYMMHYLKEAGIPYSRLHDVGGAFGRMAFVDIPNVFRDFGADENDPGNYDFTFTDRLLLALEESGVEPMYRLGVTIENHSEVKSYRIFPPKDYAKWARICEHVIRHYTEGWADGFRMKIEHWEIWNEPENQPEPDRNHMWRGDWESYMRFYGVAAKHLKSKFPHLKIGGYGSCGFYAAVGSDAEKAANSSSRTEYFVDCFTNFLARARAEKWPLDFFSFHSYSGPDAARLQSVYARRTLDEYGFASASLSCNEWIPCDRRSRCGTACQAAMVAAELIDFQNGPCDSAMIYDGRCGTGAYSPLFNPLDERPHRAYYAFMAFNELRRRGTAVACEVSDRRLRAAAAKGTDGTLALMLANFETNSIPLNIRGLSVAECRTVDKDHVYESVPTPSAVGSDTVLLLVGTASGGGRRQ